MRRFKNYSLQNRLIVAVSIIFIIAYFGALSITQAIYLQHLKKQFQEHFVKVARSLAINSLGDEDRLDQIGRIMLVENAIQFVVFYDRSKQISLSKTRTGFSDPDLLEQFIDLLDQENPAAPGLREFMQRSIMVYPFETSAGGIPGYILMGVDGTLLDQVSDKARFTALIFSVIILIIGLAILQRIGVRMMRPIKELMSGTEQVINGNFSYQIQVEDEGELGNLARKFNEMTLKLNYYNKQKSLLNKKLNEYNERLEEKVRERADQLKKIQQEVVSIFHQIPVGLLVVDRTGKVMWYNHELMNIVELPHDTRLSKNKLHDIAQLRNIGLSDVISSMSGKPDKQVMQYHLNFNRNKNSKLVEVASQALIRHDSEIDGTIFIIKDVTREVIMEKKMIQDQRLENIGKIAGGIAHDFNNILAIILPNAQLLKMQLQDHPEWVKYLDTIEKAADQAASLTRKILSFSRGSSHDNLEVLNLNKVVTEFTRMFRRVLDRKIEIAENLEPELWNIKAERSQIEQVLMNLSVNSRDAMPEGGNLNFETRNVVVGVSDGDKLDVKLEPGRYVSLFVIDSGTGIPQKYLDKIFDPFFSSKKEGQGTGLGLSVVYGIVKTHKGMIDVKSQENEGTQFRIFFPVSEEKPELVYETLETLVAGSGTLLIVDDEEMIQQTLKGMLESLNYKVIFAGNGKHAVEIYKSNADKIDAILMDIQMPVMDGVEAAGEILKVNPGARIIFTSGYAEAKSFDKLRKMGYQLFLKKPYKITNLADIIQKALSTAMVSN